MTRASGAGQEELFDVGVASGASRDELEPGAFVLRAFAFDEAPALLDAIQVVAQMAPFRHMATARGLRMSVAMTNCGAAGWLSDRNGYRYDAIDPGTGRPWPAMPDVFTHLAARAASEAGFEGFAPNACLVNRYEPGTRLTLHQDRDERDFHAPIVSVSLGVPATFLWGGATRGGRPRRVRLEHGDVVVWGGPARLSFHGIDTLREGQHALTGSTRFNLTFRRALLER
ncbi:MAG TPA: DNA oxidative demethylase AlkB [Burkholderiaceae bacterium]|jgi:alkylated DNA repair protein (DNA oxidative demethylase)|nr:DNA oxidative demethylase AlkB [Burkholderiaceae bacterium]